MSKGKAATLIILSLVLIAGVIAAIAPERGGDTPTTTAVASTEPSAQAERRWRAVAPGRVEPPSGIIKVAAPTVGVVSKVLAKVNDTAFVGELLIQLNEDEIRSRYNAAEAQAAMRLRIRNEQPPSKGADERRKAEDAVADAETAVFEAQAAVDKAAAQWRSHGGAPTALTDARATLARAENDLAKRQATLQGVNGPLPTPNEAQLASARGDLAFARANLEKLKIRAPIDGTVLQINVNPGEIVAPTSLQAPVLIANLSTLTVKAELDERDVTEVKIGQPASVRADAFPGREFAGTVASIAPMVEPARLNTRQPNNRSDVDAVTVVVNLAQPGPLLAGMRVDVYFGQGKETAAKATQ